MRCTACQGNTPADSRYCELCGQPVQAPAPASGTRVMEPRRRVVAGALAEFMGPEDTGAVHAIWSGRTSIGRDEDQDVVVRDAMVSGSHGFLFVEDDRVHYLDASTNGSVVDGVPVHGATAPLEHGSVLRIGATHLVLMLMQVRAQRGPE